MPYESVEDLAMYNIQTLIGCTDERGSAWHRRDDLMGDESNHYPGLIPLGDVTRRLFNWEPRRAQVAYLVPLEIGEPTSDAVTLINGQHFRVVPSQADRQGILRDDNDYDLGVFGSGAEHPPYQITLIREAERLTGTTLGVSSAGLLGKGGRAWVEYSMERSLHDEKSGLDYRPNLVRADSMDGSLSLTTFLSSNITICGNTLTWNMLEARASGYLTRRKHTSGIASADLADERAALGLLERVDTEFVDSIHALLARPVTPAQQIEVMDIMLPLPTEQGRSFTLADNKRDQLVALGKDPMVEPWIGTAWGEVQRYNTWQRWQAPVKNTGREERNTWRDLSGKTAEADRSVVKALESVLS